MLPLNFGSHQGIKINHFKAFLSIVISRYTLQTVRHSLSAFLREYCIEPQWGGQKPEKPAHAKAAAYEVPLPCLSLPFVPSALSSMVHWSIGLLVPEGHS